MIQRWLCLHKGPFLVHQYLKSKALSSAEHTVLQDIVENWRARLGSISEFMQQLNQAIARLANAEEKCTGRFWEGRYKSQPLLTEEALLTAMAYVDLNPIRAKMADTPEKSDHTSIKERVKPTFDFENACANNPDLSLHHLKRFNVKQLLPFESVIKNEKQVGVLFRFDDYLTLVDTSGRIQRADKRGFISHAHHPILERLGIDPEEWINNTEHFETLYYQKFYYRRRNKNAA